MGTGIGDCRLSTQRVSSQTQQGQGRWVVRGSSKVNTGEKGKETKLKAGFLLWEEAHAWAVWLTALVLFFSLMELRNWDTTI